MRSIKGPYLGFLFRCYSDPVIWALWHFSKIAMQAHKGGKSGSKFYLMTGGGHGHLRGSAGAAWFGLLYFVAICVAWIAFAEMKGI